MKQLSEFLKRKITSQKSYYVPKRVPTPNCLICHEKLQSIYLLPMPTMVIICCLVIKTWQKERRKKCYSFPCPAASRTSLVRGITIGKTGKTAVLPRGRGRRVVLLWATNGYPNCIRKVYIF